MDVRTAANLPEDISHGDGRRVNASDPGRTVRAGGRNQSSNIRVTHAFRNDILVRHAFLGIGIEAILEEPL